MYEIYEKSFMQKRLIRSGVDYAIEYKWNIDKRTRGDIEE
jgi:hypothetical protein